jgi:hypothetical protein
MTQGPAPLGSDAPPQPLAAPSASGKWRSRTTWLVAGIVTVLILLGLGIWHLAAANQTGKIVLPAALLGQEKDIGPAAEVVDRKIADEARASSFGMLGQPVAAVYGDPVAGSWFAIVAGPACPGGGCIASSAAKSVAALKAQGFADAESFSPGAGGINMVCYSQASLRTQFLICDWIDPDNLGKVVYGGGFASSLADAAAMTRQIRAAMER